MPPLSISEVADYVAKNIDDFHGKRISNLSKLKLATVLKRKNPYLFKAENMLTAEQVVRALVGAYTSSSEEGLFGNWLEGLAIFINGKVYGGKKSGINGIDLEFDKDNCRHLVSIKSGPNWGNSSQIKKMKTDFTAAKKTLRTSGSHLNIVCVNGCCYGRNTKQDNGEYFKYCGQRFWEFIGGDENLYTDIIEPLGHKAKEQNEVFQKEYAKMLNIFTGKFLDEFCESDGSINWLKIVRLNSAK